MSTMTQAPILLCAATKWECAPLVDRWRLKTVSPFRYSGEVSGVAVELLKTGIGAQNAAEALAAVTAPRFLVSTGFAGALQPKMDSGDLVLEVAGLDAELPPTARELALAQKTPIHFGRIAHTDKVLFRPEDKRALGTAERCSAVDMESAAIRDAANRLGVPFLAARVILDTINDRLPAEVPAGESIGDLVPYVLRNLSDLPLMLKTGALQRRAVARLAMFLEQLLPKL